MVINDAIQLTVTVTLFVSSYIFYKINVSFCCLLILVDVFTTCNTPVNLASMAIERYIAICKPLRYSQISRAVATEKMSAQRARNTILLHGLQLSICLLSYISPSVALVLHLIFPGRIREIRFANYLSRVHPAAFPEPHHLR
ncbi:unnamed protein product, partial [Pleuronectes platessa]